MIIKNIKLFSQKNRLLTNIILETNKEFDIIFIQEPPWLFIQSISSSLCKEEECQNCEHWTLFLFFILFCFFIIINGYIGHMVTMEHSRTFWNNNII